MTHEEPTLFAVGVRDVSIGSGVKIVEPVNVYGCTLSDGVFVGPFVEIQRGAVVGPRTRVQSHTFICEFVTIGADCFVGHGVMFINDRFSSGGPARGDVSRWERTVVGDGVSIGSNATVLPVQIVAGCVIGAGAVVTKDLSVRGVYAGNPAKLLREL